MQVEYSRLLPPEKGKPRADGGPTWETVYQQYQERLRKEPVTQRHFAVSDLLDAVVDVERGRRPAGEAVGKMQSRLTVDQDNAISRLAYGALVDAGAMGKSAPERFDEWRRIVEQPGAAKVSALYNKEYDDVFADVLSGYIKRLDVRANLVKYMDHFLIADHYAALPMIQARLSKLADELNAAGKSTEAEICRRWMVQACLGLMEYEPDAGTRLLCADLAGRTLPVNDALGSGLMRLRSDYHSAAASAITDPTSFSRTFATMPGPLSMLIAKSLSAAVAMCIAMGSLVVLILSPLIRFVVKRPPSASDCPRENLAKPGWARWLLAILVFFIFSFVIGYRRAGDLYSEECLLFVGLMCVGLGSALSFMRILPVERLDNSGSRAIAAPLFGAFFFALAVTDGSILARIARSIRFWGSAGWPLLILVLVFVVALSVSYRRVVFHVRRRAGFTFCIAMIIACVVELESGFVDGTWKMTTIMLRNEEIRLRLGADWLTRYGIPTAAAYALPTTNTAP